VGEERGIHQLKGIANPVELYRIVRLSMCEIVWLRRWCTVSRRLLDVDDGNEAFVESLGTRE